MIAMLAKGYKKERERQGGGGGEKERVEYDS